MLKNRQLVKSFISAQELENIENGEYFILADKLRAAVLRSSQKGTTKVIYPYVFLESYKFNKKIMGYDVVARISISGEKPVEKVFTDDLK